MIVYTILNEKIIDIRNEDDSYTPLENERTSNVRYEKPFYDINLDEVVDTWTQEDEDDEAENQEEIEATEAMKNHIEKGIKLHAKSYGEIWRNVVKKNKLTKEKGRTLFKWLKPTWEDLKNGDFIEAYESISAVLTENDAELQNNPVMLDVLEWLKDLINDYKTNKYDL